MIASIPLTVLLAAHIDALFDSGLISFAENGRMIVSAQITDEIYRKDCGGSRLKRNGRSSPIIAVTFSRPDAFGVSPRLTAQ
jgi:hypothetical protein